MNAPLNSQLINCTEPATPATWQARLNLEFAKRKRGVRLVKCEHEGPLYVQKAFYPEGSDCAHIYLLHPPGGLVTGDTLTIGVNALVGTHALLTTPGAGRVYKAREQGGIQTQNLHLKIEENSVLEWFPLETILFPAAQARMRTRIDLEKNAVFMGWDVTCFGLPANNITFDTGSVDQNTQIWRDGRILLNESLVIETALKDDHVDYSLLQGNAGLRALPVHGLMLAGPFAQDPPVELVDSLRVIQEQTRQLFAVSLNGEFMTVRYLGSCTEEARKLFTEAWKLIRPALIKKDPTEPRIWAT